MCAKVQLRRKKYAKNCCLDMSPDNDNCPFILSNLTFVIFSNFVRQRKARKGKSRGKSMCLGNSSYEQFQSALKHLFRMSNYTMEPNFFVSLKQFTKGILRHVADKKVIEGDVRMIGKKKMGFDVYRKICELFLKEEGDEFVFARAFLFLSGISWRDPKMLSMLTFCTLSGLPIALCSVL